MRFEVVLAVLLGLVLGGAVGFTAGVAWCRSEGRRWLASKRR